MSAKGNREKKWQTKVGKLRTSWMMIRKRKKWESTENKKTETKRITGTIASKSRGTKNTREK